MKDRTAILEAEHRVARLTDRHDVAMRAWLRAVQDYQTDPAAGRRLTRRRRTWPRR